MAILAPDATLATKVIGTYGIGVGTDEALAAITGLISGEHVRSSREQGVDYFTQDQQLTDKILFVTDLGIDGFDAYNASRAWMKNGGTITTRNRSIDYTTSRGVVRVDSSHGPSYAQYVRDHESVHQFFTPGVGVPSTDLSSLTRLRQRAALQAYKNSSVLRYTEEALAEGFAVFQRTGSFQKALGIGVRFPIRNGYVTLPAVLTEAGVGGTAFGLLLFGAYEVGNSVSGE